MHQRIFLCTALAAFAGLGAVPATFAAESYDNCAGTITSLPAVISTQGVWCLKGDLATSMASGNAIEVTANNVTIDCNDFKIGGLAAGPETGTVGIRGRKTNTTIRNCNIRGFLRGIYLDATGGGGHVVEDNRLVGNTEYGILVYGDGSIVRDNQVTDIFGTALSGLVSAGITVVGDSDVLHNSVRDVLGQAAQGAHVVGIRHMNGQSGVIEGNRIGGMVPVVPDGHIYGIYTTSTNVIIRGNSIARATDEAIAIHCHDDSSSAYENITTGPGTTVLANCHDAGSNTTP